MESFISQNSSSVVDFSVEFNFLCGENIRLAVLVLEDSVNEFVPAMDNYFKSFFAERKLRTTQMLLPVAGIFKPFEQNTIQYGLFDISNEKSQNEVKLSANLSRVIISALKDDEIDDETIVTFGFYLHAAIFKISQDRSDLINEVKSYYINYSLVTEAEISIGLIDDKFKSNKQELINIYQNILIENQSDLPDWMAGWIACIKDEIETYSTSLTDILKAEKYYRIISIVNRQLGISRNSWLMISYFLRQTIDAYHCANL